MVSHLPTLSNSSPPLLSSRSPLFLSLIIKQARYMFMYGVMMKSGYLSYPPSIVMARTFPILGILKCIVEHCQF